MSDKKSEKKYLRFVEPHITGGDSVVTISEAKAIEATKKVHPEMSDEDALSEFFVIHFADRILPADIKAKAMYFCSSGRAIGKSITQIQTLVDSCHGVVDIKVEQSDAQMQLERLKKPTCYKKGEPDSFCNNCLWEDGCDPADHNSEIIKEAVTATMSKERSEEVKDFMQYYVDFVNSVASEQSVEGRIEQGIIGASTETGELLDILKKTKYQERDFDRTNAIEECGDTLFYLTEVLDALGSSIFEAIQKNIDKLKERYKGKRFDKDRSLNRDTNAERKILERSEEDQNNKQSCDTCKGLPASCGFKGIKGQEYCPGYGYKDMSCFDCLFVSSCYGAHGGSGETCNEFKKKA